VDREIVNREIVDREEEMASLKSQVELLADGQRRVVFVTGEAGIGKTALVDAFCQRLDSGSAALPVRLGRGQCVEGFGRKEEYYPVMEALSQICAQPEGETACGILARMAPAWLGALGRDSGNAAPSTGRERMPGDLCAALEELAAEGPLILVFEDLHWADESTLHLISALARRRAQAKLLVLATYRAQDVAAEHPLRALKQDLRLRRLCTEIALTPLPETAVSELVARELKQEALPKGLTGFVHRRSEGNPLFVIAILEHLIAQRYLVRKQHGGKNTWEQRVAFAEMEAGVPDGLAQMIELEMARLSESEQRLLEAGSLMNVAFPAWAVAAALETDAAEVEEACDGLARRLHFVDRAGQDELPDGTRTSFYVFAHELYREVLYGRQTEARRARRHIRIAKRLAELFAGREGNVAREIAMHYEAAGDWRLAVDALRAAAKHAAERHAHAEAAELLEHALRVAENLTGTVRDAAAQEIGNELNLAREASMAGIAR
jgi:predicted ATPase